VSTYQEIYRPGDKVPHTGIYDVSHGSFHAPRHQVTCVGGGHFPTCKHCGHAARFQLNVVAVMVEQDNNFQSKDEKANLFL
jgi:hypothetical protein